MAYSASPLVTFSGGGTDGFTTGSVDTTGANLIVVVVSSYSAVGAPPFSDSKGNTWLGLTEQLSGVSVRGRLFYAYNPTVGTSHTFTLSGANTYCSLVGAAWSGALSTDPFDVQNGALSASASSLQTGSVTPGQNDELVVAASGWGLSRTMAIDSPFTIAAQKDWVTAVNQGSALAYSVQTTATARNPTWSWTGVTEAVALIATFKAAAVAVGHPTMRRWSAVPHVGIGGGFGAGDGGTR